MVLACAFSPGLPLTQWLEQPLVQTVLGGCLSVMEALGRISSSTLAGSSRCSHLENWTLLLCPRIIQLILAYGCCPWSTSYRFRDACAAWFNSGYCGTSSVFQEFGMCTERVCLLSLCCFSFIVMMMSLHLGSGSLSLTCCVCLMAMV